MFDTQFLAFGTFYLLLDSCVLNTHFTCRLKVAITVTLMDFVHSAKAWNDRLCSCTCPNPCPPGHQQVGKPKNLNQILGCQMWCWFMGGVSLIPHISSLTPAGTILVRMDQLCPFLPRKLLKHPDPTTNWFHFETQDHMRTVFIFLFLILDFPLVSFKTWFCIALEIWFCIVVLLTTLSASSAVTLVLLLPLMNSQVEN